MNWLGVVIFAALLAFLIWALIRERRELRRLAESFRLRQEQRADCPKPELFADPDFRRVCRALAAVAEEAMRPPGVQVDPERLTPSDTLWQDLHFSLDSLSHWNLICELEKEFGRKLKWRDFKAATTIHDVYAILFPEKIAAAAGDAG